ncbi:MAG: NUDIX domain-containing protein, partial [Pseudomonadota bacterium]
MNNFRGARMDHRQRVQAIVENIQPLDAREQRDKADTMRWIASGAELFRLKKPATPPRHLVSYFVLLDGDHVLLVDHVLAELWLPPGGHLDPGEHPADAARRECREELDLEAEFLGEAPVMLTVEQTVGISEPHTDVTFWYALRG